MHKKKGKKTRTVDILPLGLKSKSIFDGFFSVVVIQKNIWQTYRPILEGKHVVYLKGTGVLTCTKASECYTSI